MSRTPTLPLDDRQMWRKLIARVHPDAGGEHNLFIWAQNVREHICGGDVYRSQKSRWRDNSPGGDDVARVPFDPRSDFAALTGQALRYEAGNYGRILALLKDCWPAEHLAHEEQRGVSYKRLAYIAHLCGMSKRERIEWYRVAESIPLSDWHAGHIISAAKRAGAA